MTGDHLDLTSEPSAGTPREGPRFLGIRFACCDVYTRVYVNCEGTAYVGHCPKCARRVQVRIGANGTDSRFFTAY